MTDLDTRLNACRPDLADSGLRGKVDAAAYADGRAARVAVGRLALMTHPGGGGRMGSELLFGEEIRIFEERDGWAWLQNATDGYVGYARADGTGAPAGPPTHYVSALRTFLYDEPDLKSAVIDMASMNSPLVRCGEAGGFMELATGGWIWAAHCAAIDEHEDDHAAVALRFLETPYLWGGRSSVGLDCSGLVQMALARCGKPILRDTDMQADFGDPVPFTGDEAALAHGDLVFWKGHVGIWLAGGDFIHANATDMKVARGQFAAIADHIARVTGGGVTAVRRP